MGSFVNSIRDVIKSDWLVIDFSKLPGIDACIFFRGSRTNENWFGRKIQGIGHNGDRHSKAHVIDLLIGSSMGGYFAYCLSTHLGVKTLLFNPAVHSRSIEPVVIMGSKESTHLVVLGNGDDIIRPELTEEFFNKVGGTNIIIREDIGHIIPIEVFKNYIKLY
jgi:hypothetical protein